MIFNFGFIKFVREREESALVRVKESEQELTRLDNERIRLLREVIIINKIYDNYDIINIFIIIIIIINLIKVGSL